MLDLAKFRKLQHCSIFENVKLQSSELDSKKLLTSFMRTLGIASGQRMLLNTGSEHYVVLVF